MLIAGGYEGDTWYGGNGDFAAFVYASQNVTVHELWSCQSRKDYYSGFVDLNLKKGWNIISKKTTSKKYSDYESNEFVYINAPEGKMLSWQILGN